MYEWLKRLILPLLRIEDSEPHPPAGLSPTDVLRVERAAPGFLRLKLFGWAVYAVAWSLGVLLASATLLAIDARLLLLVIPLILAAIAKAATLYVTMRLDYELRWYVITDRSLLIREGVWNTQETTLTFANAQNVRVTQGPLERLFGFSNVEIEVAGGGSGENGVSRNQACLRGLARPEEVRALILDRLKQQRNAGLGDPDDLGAPMSDTSPLALAERRTLAIATQSGAASVAKEAWDEARALRIALERRAR